MNVIDFISIKTAMYDSHRSESSSDKYSNLNIFLQFGNISPIGIVLQINLLAEWA